jgi:hypothetical protein
MEEIATPREKRPWFAMTAILIIFEMHYLKIITDQGAMTC